MPKFYNKKGNIFIYSIVHTVINSDGSCVHLDENRNEIVDKETKESLSLVVSAESNPFYLATSALSGEREDKFYKDRASKSFHSGNFGVGKKAIVKSLKS